MYLFKNYFKFKKIGHCDLIIFVYGDKYRCLSVSPYDYLNGQQNKIKEN